MDPGHTPIREPPAGAAHTPAVDPNIMPAPEATEVRKPVLATREMSPPPFASGALPESTFDVPAAGGGDGSGGDGTSDESQRVSAYARLDFESFTFYVQTLNVVLGRRGEDMANQVDVDVHLGPAKAISRRHARIFYNFATQRFELTVMGRNGAFVNDDYVSPGTTVPLAGGTRIQIHQIPFMFVLPDHPSGLGGLEGAPEGAAAGLDGEGSPVSRRRRSPEYKLENGDENNFFAVHASASPTGSATGANSGSGTGTGSGSSAGATRRKPRKEYAPEEIPPQYREKPSHSYSHLITTALRERAPRSGMTLADIYDAIKDIFPYYFYCPPAWQNSVRHNLSSSKAFRKVSKEGKGWLWGLDEEYLQAKEEQKKRAAAKQLRQQEAAAAAAAQSSDTKTIAELAQQIPARPRAPQPSSLSQDTIKLLAGLQQRLQAQLARAGQPAINPQLLTNALAMVIAQAAKSVGGIQNLNNVLGNPAAVQGLLVQALELMKRQAQGASGSSGAGVQAAAQAQAAVQAHPDPTGLPSAAAPAAASTAAPAAAAAPAATEQDTESELSKTPTPAPTPAPQAQQPAASAPASAPAPASASASASASAPAPAQAPAQAQAQAQAQTQAPAQAQAQPSPSAQTQPAAPAPVQTQPAPPTTQAPQTQPAQPAQAQPSQPVQPAPLPAQAPAQASAQAPGQAQTQPAQPAQPAAAQPAAAQPVAAQPAAAQPAAAQPAAAQPATAARPQSAEQLAELLARAEKIPNPTPQVLAMIEQLRAHQQRLKRPADADREPAAKRVHVD